MTDTGTARWLYLDLLKRCVVNLIYEDPAVRFPWDDSSDLELLPFDRGKRVTATDWPSQAHTMIGMRRLDNIEELVTDVLGNGTPGDLIETGVWRGGSTIFMRGLLKAYEANDRDGVGRRLVRGFPSTAEEGASELSFNSPELAPLRGFRLVTTNPRSGPAWIV